MDRWEKSVYVQIQILVSEERGIFMEIQMNIDEECLRYIMEHGLLEKVYSVIGLGEVLLWMDKYPEVLEKDKPSYLYTGEGAVDVVLKMERQGDTFIVTVDQICY